ncbi:MAG TPA: glutamate synthase subunit beta [Opitutales bacterium]|nr:glutamate synthase subunit beta [Opitutales bacterium]
MGKPTGFIETQRATIPDRTPLERLKDWKEIHAERDDKAVQKQASRCMDCGTPFCHIGMVIGGMGTGCPIHNLIPEFNDLVYKGRWEDAYERLRRTNNFPEFTGRVCPAPCEGSCTLGVIQPPVTIKNIENSIADVAWEKGYYKVRKVLKRTGKKVAVVGSGPAGLAAADQLNQAGHSVTVFERADRVGGLLMYGIPNMKLDKKHVVLRRVKLMEKEGVKFVCNANVGQGEYTAEKLLAEFDAVALCCGATLARDLKAPGRDAKGIHFAVDFLSANTKQLLDTNFKKGSLPEVNAKGLDVVVIGGGDTGTDCVGTSLRHGCRSVVQLEIMPQPPATRAANNPWPEWPKVLKTDYGQQEADAKQGGDPRRYLVSTECFIKDDAGNLTGLRIVDIEWKKDASGRMSPVPIEGTRREIPAQLALIAMGFIGPEQPVMKAFGVEADARSNAKADYGKFSTNVPKVFAAGDMRRGQSLVVWAINEGRACASRVDEFLMGKSFLPMP